MGTPVPPDGAAAGDANASDAGFASYVPHDLKYDGSFEDNLMRIIFDPVAKRDGIRVIPEDSDETPIDNVSVRAIDISQQSLPIIAEDELPIPLDDPRRIYASPIPGVRLTHPGGYLEGGPGLDPGMDTFPDDFLSNNPRLTSAEELRGAIDRDVDINIQLLKERMQARQRAKESNEQTEKDIRSLIDQHSMELKIQRRMVEEQKAKKEAREKRRRKEKDVG